MSKEDISLEVRENVLTLKGERRPDPEAEVKDYCRREICFGTFQRAFTLQARVDPGKVRARFKNGILRIEIPKHDEQTPRRVNVDID